MKITLFIAFMLTLTSCQRGCQQMNREFETGERNYTVVMFSGGDTVFTDRFKGVINYAEKSDGCYYFKGDTLIEISGDYIIKSEK